MKRLLRNLRFLGLDVFRAWVCRRCYWLNRRADDMCLLCPQERDQ